MSNDNIKLDQEATRRLDEALENPKEPTDALRELMNTPMPGDQVEPAWSAITLRTSRFTPKEILFDSKGFVIASGDWKEPGSDFVRHNKLACRWHEKDGIGYPNGFGHSQWMNLGNLMRRDVEIHKLSKFAKRIKLNFNPAYEEVIVGQWVMMGSDWLLVDQVYGESGDLVSAMGLGKPGSFPVETHRINDVATGLSTLGIWHGVKSAGDYLVWISPQGQVVTTKVNDNIHQNGNIILKSTYAPNEFDVDGDYHATHMHIGFTYQLSNHALVAKLPGDLEWTELKSKLRELADKFIDAVGQDIGTLKSEEKYIRNIEEEVSHSKNDIFKHDVVLDAKYYDLTDILNGFDPK